MGRQWQVAVAAWMVALAGCMPFPDPVVVSSGHGDTWAVAVDATHVYWTEAGKLWRVPKAGGPEQLLSQAVGASPFALQVKDGVVCWLTRDLNTGRGSLSRLDPGGEAVVVADDLVHPMGLAMDSSRVYWTVYDDGRPPVDGVPAGAVQSATLDGGAPATLVAGYLQPAGLALDGDHLYLTTEDAVVEVPVAGGATRDVAAIPVGYGQSVGVGGDQVYWIQSGAGRVSVMQAPRAGGPGLEIAYIQGADTVLAADARGLYLLNLASLWKLRPGAAAPDLLAPTSEPYVGFGRGLALDATRVYWAGEHGVLALARD